MGICFCCLSEDDQIKKVLVRLDVVLASHIKVGDSKFAVGRVIQSHQTICSPVSNRPCVYYEVVVEQEEEEKYTDADGNEHRRMVWRQVCREIKKTDFLLSDGNGSPLFIPFSQCDAKIYAVEDSGGEQGGFFEPRASDNNALLKELLQRHGVLGVNFFGINTGPRIRYREGIFAVNEQVAVLGCASMSTINGYGIMVLNPCKSTDLTDAYFEENKWTDLEIKSWKKLTEHGALLGTDDPKYLKVIFCLFIYFFR